MLAPILSLHKIKLPLDCLSRLDHLRMVLVHSLGKLRLLLHVWLVEIGGFRFHKLN